VINLIEFARRFKGFLAFAALIFLGLIFLVSYLFSEGIFDQLLSNFENLSPNQFLTVVYLAIGLPFVIIVLLIILGFVTSSREKQAKEKPQSGLLYVVVHDEADKTKLVDGAEVRLLLPEPRVAHTDKSGSVKFAFPAEFTGNSYLINASKEGYQTGDEQHIKMSHGATVYIGLKHGNLENTIQSALPARPVEVEVYRPITDEI
jgi:hypothetical protein